MFETEEKLTYDSIYENNCLEPGFKYDLIVLRNLKDLGLIESYFDRDKDLSYRVNKKHPYYIKRKRSENLNKIKDESYK